MTVATADRVRRAGIAVAAGVLLFTSCGPDGPSAGAPRAPVTTTTVTDGAFAGPDAAEGTGDDTDHDDVELPPMHVEAALGYPRDLLDRGRVNIRIDRPDDVSIVLQDKQLVARHFTPAPLETRRTVIPPNGQVVALQTLFGDVSNCDDDDPVDAELAVSYTIGDDPTVRRTSIELDDATTLDRIRLQVCTQRRVVAGNEFELQADEVDGETMAARLVVRRTTGTDRLAFDAIKGTVLFGADAAVPAGAPDRVLEPDEDQTTIAITLTVNRCDPHAVGETTRKYGLDVYVAVDDIEAQRIDVPIDSIVPRLDEMLAHCRERTGQ